MTVSLEGAEAVAGDNTAADDRTKHSDYYGSLCETDEGDNDETAAADVLAPQHQRVDDDDSDDHQWIPLPSAPKDASVLAKRSTKAALLAESRMASSSLEEGENDHGEFEVPSVHPAGSFDSGCDLSSYAESVLDGKAEMDMCQELRLLFELAAPTVLVQFSLWFVFTETASAIGRYLSNEELAAFSLASLTGNLTCLSVVVGVLSASETLSPMAYSAKNYKEVGRIAIRGYVVGMICLCPALVPLVTLTDRILVVLHQDPTTSLLASEWVRIYLLGVPFVLLFRCLQRFLTCQHIVMPLAYSAAFGAVFVHPCLLAIFIPTLGFVGSALAVVITQVVTVALAILYVKWTVPHEPETWPGCAELWKEAVRVRPMVDFFKLAAGGLLALSEWWFWECLCFIAGTFGVIPLCVHTIAYQLCPLTFMIPLGIGIGLTVRLGSLLATENVKEAKHLALATLAFTACVALAVASTIYLGRSWIVGMFTHDEEVKQGCEEIWIWVSTYMIFVFMFGINSAIVNALGLQLKKGVMVVVVLWCCALPFVWYFVVTNDGGVPSIWKSLPFVYLTLNCGCISIYITADWKVVSRRNIEKMNHNHHLHHNSDHNETKSLL